MNDLRPYAERLVLAMPERFEIRIHEALGFIHERTGFESDEDAFEVDAWFLDDKDYGSEFDACRYEGDGLNVERSAWAFFGPLLDEFKCDPILWLGSWQGQSQTMTWLEAVAEAVCQAAEAKAKEVTS